MPLTSDSQGCPPLKYGNPGSQASEHRPSLNTRFVTQLPIFWIQVQREKKVNPSKSPKPEFLSSAFRFWILNCVAEPSK